MDLEKEEAHEVDLIAPRLHSSTGGDEAAPHKLRPAPSACPTIMIWITGPLSSLSTQGDSKWLKRYRKRRSRFPIRLPRMGPHTKMDAGFQVLNETVIVPGPREYQSNDLISKGTWMLLDQCAGL